MNFHGYHHCRSLLQTTVKIDTRLIIRREIKGLTCCERYHNGPVRAGATPCNLCLPSNKLASRRFVANGTPTTVSSYSARNRVSIYFPPSVTADVVRLCSLPAAVKPRYRPCHQAFDDLLPWVVRWHSTLRKVSIPLSSDRSTGTEDPVESAPRPHSCISVPTVNTAGPLRPYTSYPRTSLSSCPRKMPSSEVHSRFASRR